MKMTHHRLSRNFIAWKEGNYTLSIEIRGTREELLQKLKEEIVEDLTRNA